MPPARCGSARPAGAPERESASPSRRSGSSTPPAPCPPGGRREAEGFVAGDRFAARSLHPARGRSRPAPAERPRPTHRPCTLAGRPGAHARSAGPGGASMRRDPPRSGSFHHPSRPGAGSRDAPQDSPASTRHRSGARPRWPRCRRAAARSQPATRPPIGTRPDGPASRAAARAATSGALRTAREGGGWPRTLSPRRRRRLPRLFHPVQGSALRARRNRSVCRPFGPTYLVDRRHRQDTDSRRGRDSSTRSQRLHDPVAATPAGLLQAVYAAPHPSLRRGHARPRESAVAVQGSMESIYTRERCA